MAVGTSLVRLALASHLDMYRDPHSKQAGRLTLADRMGISKTGVTERLNGRAPGLLQLVQAAGRFGIAPGIALDDLARRVAVDPDPNSWIRRVDVRLWRDLREANGLVDGHRPAFRAAVDVTLASAALISSYPALTNREARTPLRMDPADQRAAEVLTGALCRITSGPFGASQDAFASLAVLAPITLPTIASFLASSPVGSNVVRAIDRALRIGKAGTSFRSDVEHVLANPPVLLFRNALWMRAVRRVMWLARQNDRQLPGRWPLNQAVNAVRGERSYAWSGSSERRYALWVFAEFSHPDDGDAWAFIDHEASHFGAGFVADLAEARDRLAADVREHRPSDFFYFRPADGWTPPAPLAAIIDAVLDARPLHKAPNWPDPPEWKYLHALRRDGVKQLIREALLAPCTIRHRTAVDTLQACPPDVRHGAASFADTILVECMDDDGRVPGEVVPLAERCLHLIGALRARPSAEILNRLLRMQNLPEPVSKMAILAAGDLGRTFPDEAPGLMAYVRYRVIRTPSEPLIAAAIHACVFSCTDPSRHLPDEIVATGGPARAAMFAWARATLADPLIRCPQL